MSGFRTRKETCTGEEFGMFQFGNGYSITWINWHCIAKDHIKQRNDG